MSTIDYSWYWDGILCKMSQQTPRREMQFTIQRKQGHLHKLSPFPPPNKLRACHRDSCFCWRWSESTTSGVPLTFIIMCCWSKENNNKKAPNKQRKYFLRAALPRGKLYTRAYKGIWIIPSNVVEDLFQSTVLKFSWSVKAVVVLTGSGYASREQHHRLQSLKTS